MTLAISMLNNIFPDYKLKRKTVISSTIPKCYTMCHNVNHFSSKNCYLRLMNSIIVAISGRDTFRALGIYFRSLANSVHGTTYEKRETRLLQSLTIGGLIFTRHV